MRILVVEDEPGIAASLQRGLADEGYGVDVEHDGAEGLARAQGGRYDLIILDILLPSLNGYRVCRELRADDDWTPILMLTAKAGEWDEAEGLETGADDYLTKPFSMVVLLARVGALLRRPRMRGDRPFVAGNLRLDPARHRCWRDEQEVELTAREMEVLAYLVLRAGQVVSKVELIDNVWGESFEGSPNIAEVYIRHLRGKIDEPFGCRSIETVRGVGYRLDPQAGTR